MPKSIAPGMPVRKPEGPEESLLNARTRAALQRFAADVVQAGGKQTFPSVQYIYLPGDRQSKLQAVLDLASDIELLALRMALKRVGATALVHCHEAWHSGMAEYRPSMAPDREEIVLGSGSSPNYTCVMRIPFARTLDGLRLGELSEFSSGLVPGPDGREVLQETQGRMGNLLAPFDPKKSRYTIRRAAEMVVKDLVAVIERNARPVDLDAAADVPAPPGIN